MSASPFFNEDHESIREMARDFADRTLSPIAAEVDRTDAFPLDVVKQMAELGFLGLKIPEAYGGLGLDMRSYVCAMEELARKSVTATLFLSSANSLATAPIVLSGTEAQKQAYLPGVAAGERFIAFGLTEPNAGSDAASLTTRAERDGDSYLLNGRKCFITFAPMASQAILYAKTSPDKGAKGITAFVVDMSLPGVSCGKHEEKMGLHGSPTAEIVFTDMIVPKENMLGREGKGFNIAMQTLDGGRIGIAAQSLGIAEGALEEAKAYTKGRVQFGKPISKFQNTQFTFADMELGCEAGRLLTYQAAMKKGAGERYTKEAAMAKLFCSEHAMKTTTKALQMFGGYGYTKDYPMERMMRDAKITEIYEGTSEVQRIVISANMGL